MTAWRYAVATLVFLRDIALTAAVVLAIALWTPFSMLAWAYGVIRREARKDLR